MASKAPFIVYYNNDSMDFEDPETVKSWPIGRQLVYALQIEQHYPGHIWGKPVFIELINNLTQHDMENISSDGDTIKMFAIIVTDDNVELLSYILNHPYIPNSSCLHNTAKNALKKAIRIGSLNVLNYLIQQNVIILSNDVNKFDDIKSLIFNILKSYEIGKIKNKNNNIIIANRFWKYLAKSLYNLYDDNSSKIDDKNDNKGKNTKDKLSENWNEQIKKTQHDDKISTIRYSKFMISHPLIQYSIYKYILPLVVSKHYAYKLLPILQFICEHYMTFDDKYSVKQLYLKCNNDTMFDCSKLIEFKINFPHAVLQQNKDKRYIKLFCSEYITVKLINDYLGIDINKINKIKRINQYTNNNDNEENKLILDCIKYLIGNGVGNNLNNVIFPLINDYKNIFVGIKDNNEQNENNGINDIIQAVEYGQNVWILKTLENNQMSSLFSNVCNNQIELPSHIIQFIISFLVL